MITLRPGQERGHTQLSWLDSYHTFSFAQFYDPQFTEFRQLRVINEDRIEPGTGFPTHSHRDMEIITYVLAGALEHKDSTGTSSVIRPGEVQRMSAGTGISHSEYNHSQTELVHLLQIWILPSEKNLKPSYEQRTFNREECRGKWNLIASPDGGTGSVTIHQDAKLFVSIHNPGEQLRYRVSSDRHAWIQVVRGAIMLNSHALEAGDGAGASEEEFLELTAIGPAEVLLFDLA